MLVDLPECSLLYVNATICVDQTGICGIRHHNLEKNVARINVMRNAACRNHSLTPVHPPLSGTHSLTPPPPADSLLSHTGLRLDGASAQLCRSLERLGLHVLEFFQLVATGARGVLIGARVVFIQPTVGRCAHY